ncbi:ABC transporter substrate-binding protein [Desnuesiella massiliensis]|uniref:ABC transporter substrate-binding protein n=1 Tax=Desnuesiella massiliensis TaxID=1650662 RepID=UPI0006E3B600|nr:ABC transporter substrate-binding protein [Desnuesiella massiliensis]
MKKGLLKKVLATAMSMALVLSLSACAKKSEATGAKSDSTTPIVDKIKKSGKLVLGTSPDYPPYEFINGKNEIVGFDIEIAKELAKDLGVKLEIKDMKFDGLLAALQSGNVDIVLAGMTPTDERKQNVDFSKIYYTSLQGIVVRTEDKDKYNSLDALAGKKIGVQKGSIQEGLAKEQIKNADIKALGKVTDIMLELKNKKVDAIVVEKPVAEAYVSKNPDLSIPAVTVTQSEENGSAVAVKKGSSDLIEALNKSLDRIIKDKLVDKFVTEANEQVE